MDGLEQQPASSGRLKRAKSVELDGQRSQKRQRTESRRDDWDVPLSSSQTKSQVHNQGNAVVITEPEGAALDSTESCTIDLEQSAKAAHTSVLRTSGSAETVSPQVVIPRVPQSGNNNHDDSTHQAIVREDDNPASDAEVHDPAHSEKRKRKVTQEEQDFDELAISLPKEHYQPRSSRSRSNRVITTASQSTQDLSENAQASAAKRRKTNKSAWQKDHTALQDMGFTSSQADRALQETDGNLMKATDWLLEGRDHGSKQDPPQIASTGEEYAASRSKGRPRKKPTILNDENAPRPAERQDAKRHATPDDEDNVLGQDVPQEAGHAQNEVTAEAHAEDVKTDVKTIVNDRSKKKKGRGRPKKKPPENKENTNDDSNQKLATQDNQESKDLAESTEQRNNSTETTKDDELDDLAERHPQQNAEADEDSKQDTDVPAVLVHSDCQESKDQNNAAKHAEYTLSPNQSPVKTGKVPLRVGLSKRMKIPSLLSSARKAGPP